MTRKRIKQEIKLGFKAVPKDCLKAYVGHMFTFVGKKLIFFPVAAGAARIPIYIDNRLKTLTGYVLDESGKMVKTLLDDGKILWTTKTSLLHLLLMEEKSGDAFKQNLAEKIEFLSKPDSPGLSISDTKEILTQCLAELNRSKQNPDESSK
jgi:hypothetical protein